MICMDTYLLNSCMLAVKPQGSHELAQALFDIKAELSHMPVAQPCMHDFMRYDAPSQQARQPTLYQDGSDLYKISLDQLLSKGDTSEGFHTAKAGPADLVSKRGHGAAAGCL